MRLRDGMWRPPPPNKNLQDASQRFEDKLRMVDEYLKFRKISIEHRRRIQNYYTGYWRLSGAIFEEQMILQGLPNDLRTVALEQISAEAIKRVPVLKGIGDQCAAAVYCNLHPHFFEEEGVIYTAKDFGSDMFFVTAGSVQLQGIDLHVGESDAEKTRQLRLSPRARSRSHHVEKDDFFGEMCMFPDLCKYRTETAIANSRVESLILSRGDFCELSRLQPAFAQRLEHLCALKAARYGISNQAVESLVQQAASRLNFSRMDRRVDDVKAELIAAYEHKLASMGLRLPGRDKGFVYQIWMRQHQDDGEAGALAIDDFTLSPQRAGKLMGDKRPRAEWTRVSCTFTSAGQMLHVEHDVQALGLLAGRIASLGTLKEFGKVSDVDVAIFHNGGQSPPPKIQARGFSFTVEGLDDRHGTSGGAVRRMQASLENPKEAEEMIEVLKDVAEAQRSARLDGTFDGKLLPLVGGGAAGAAGCVEHKGFSAGVGLTSQKRGMPRVLDDDEYLDHTCTPPSEYEAAAHMWSANGVYKDAQRLTSAYADASPAVRIVMEELHKMRAEQARASQRQELLHSQVQQALMQLAASPKIPRHRTKSSADERGWGHA